MLPVHRLEKKPLLIDEDYFNRAKAAYEEVDETSCKCLIVFKRFLIN